MNDTIKDAIGEALHSKKFLAFLASALVTVLIYLAAYFKLGLDEQTATNIANRLVALVIAYMASQGIADHGKEAAQIHADAAAAQPAGSATVDLEVTTKGPTPPT